MPSWYIVKDKNFPSGENDGELIWDEFSIAISLFPEAMSWIKIFAIPVSNETYATFFESGDHTGEIIGSVLLSRICSLAPSASAITKLKSSFCVT